MEEHNMIYIEKLLDDMYCSLNDSQEGMVEQWGAEDNVGTEDVLRRVKAWDLASGLSGTTRELRVQKALSQEVSELAYKIGNKCLYVQTRDDGYDYIVFDNLYHVLDDGIYDDVMLDIFEVSKILLAEVLHTENTIPERCDIERLVE